MTDDILRFCGAAFLFLVAIGALCFIRYLVAEVCRWREMSWRGLLLNGWEPGIQPDTWKIDEWWRSDD